MPERPLVVKKGTAKMCGRASGGIPSSRNPNLVANLALIRNALLRLLNEHHPNRSLPEIRECFAAKPSQTLALFRSKL